MSQNRERKRKFDIPIWCKANLSIEEAAAYSGIGMAKLYEMTERPANKSQVEISAFGSSEKGKTKSSR